MENSSKALTAFGSKKEVAEMKERLLSMALPGGKKLQPGEAEVLAQLSIAHGLDATNGEIWMLPTGPMIGIKGLRKKARQQISNGKAGNFWTNFRQIENPSERESLQIPDGALAFECRIFDTETINTYTSTIKQLKECGMPWEGIVAIVGEQPYTSGYGYARKGEPSKMTPISIAMKRAEAEAIKRRFDVPFGIAVEGIDGEIIDGEAREVVERQQLIVASAEKRAADNAALYGEGEQDKAPTTPAQPTVLETAKDLLTPGGKRLGDLSLDDLVIVKENKKHFDLAAAAALIIRSMEMPKD